MGVTVHHGDMREVLARLVADGVRVHSIVSDPPYHLTSIVKRWSNSNPDDAEKNATARKVAGQGASPHGRAARGFMGKKWDGGDIAFQAETWRLCWELLPPGGHLLAFSGTRTYHRMACAIEDAGFEIRDTIAWLYGSGFPKSHNVAKGIDKAAGRPIEIIPGGSPVKRMIPGADQAKQGWEKNSGREYQPGQHMPSEEAAPWEGWGTALKPALEPICVARKPLDSTVAANVLQHGTGALNIDGCRVRYVDDQDREKAHNNALGPVERSKTTKQIFDGGRANGGFADTHSASGRWPANVVHDGSAEVAAAFPSPHGAGHARAGQFGGAYEATSFNLGVNGARPMGRIGDEGSASRFFYSSKADADDRLGSKHPTVKPVDLMRWLVRLVTPPGGLVLDPFAGSGTTGMACLAEGFDAILVEREAEYVADIRRRIAHVSGGDTPLFGDGKPTPPRSPDERFTESSRTNDSARRD